MRARVPSLSSSCGNHLAQVAVPDLHPDDRVFAPDPRACYSTPSVHREHPPRDVASVSPVPEQMCEGGRLAARARAAGHEANSWMAWQGMQHRRPSSSFLTKCRLSSKLVAYRPQISPCHACELSIGRTGFRAHQLCCQSEQNGEDCVPSSICSHGLAVA
jgi:hypothetical protein